MSVLETRGPVRRKVLAADITAIQSQTTLQDVTGLGVSIGASSTEIWLVRYTVRLNAANTTMDLKLGFTGPASCTLKWGTTGGVVAGWGGVASGSTPAALLTESDTLSVGSPAAADFGAVIEAIVFGGGTAGTVQLQYAQNTSDAGTLQVKKGSCVEAIKLAA
jgi:hypothetical protein